LGSYENKNLLHRFWFEFDKEFGGWYGVTAYSYEDAISLLNEWEFKEKATPPLKKMIEDGM
jgi:hypothetical protein